MGGARPPAETGDDMAIPDSGSRPDGGGHDLGGSDGGNPNPGTGPWAVATGIYGGWVKSVAIDPKTPNTMWAGTDSAGLFKSTDGGLTWSPAGCAGGSVPILAVDPTRASTLFAGCSSTSSRGATQLLRTTDGGATWSPLTVSTGSLNLYSVVVHPKTAGVVYAQSDSTVFKSTDGGDTWGPASGGLSVRYSQAAIAVDPTDDKIVYYLTQDGPYKSVDGGVTATLRTSGIPKPPSYGALWAIALDPHAPQTLYISTISVGKTFMYKTTDGGLSWTETLGAPQSNNDGGDALTVDSSGNVYSVRTSSIYSAVSKSSDGGASWTRISTDLRDDMPTLVAVHPTDPKKIWIAQMIQGLVASSDGGATFSVMNRGITNANVYSLSISPSDDSIVYAGAQNGLVYKSTDEGRTFLLPSAGPTAQLPAKLNVTALAVHPTNPSIVYAGTTQDNLWGSGGFFPRSGVWKSIDGGVTWYELGLGGSIGGDGPRIGQLVIDPTNPKIVYAGGRYKTTDEGITWQTLPGSGSQLVLDPADSKKLFEQQGEGGWWMRSSDGGITLSGPWMSGMMGPAGHELLSALAALAIDPTAPTTYYGCTDQGLYKTTNGGSTWGHAAVGFMNDACAALAIAPSSPQRIYAISSRRELYATDDGAASWRQIKVDLSQQAYSTTQLAVSPSHPDTLLLSMTYSVGVLRTATSGK